MKTNWPRWARRGRMELVASVVIALVAEQLLEAVRMERDDLKQQGVKPALFSSNSEGACPACNGAGVIFTDLGPMASVATPCEDCGGKRFQAQQQAQIKLARAGQRRDRQFQRRRQVFSEQRPLSEVPSLSELASRRESRRRTRTARPKAAPMLK